MTKFKVGEEYSVHEMSGGEFVMAYDGFYAVVDGKMEALSMWEDSEAEERMQEDKTLTEEEAYADARESILFHLRMVYEDAKDIAAFVGVSPVGPGRAFDFYSTYKCLEIA
jgi:hypothetical protein